MSLVRLLAGLLLFLLLLHAGSLPPRKVALPSLFPPLPCLSWSFISELLVVHQSAPAATASRRHRCLPACPATKTSDEEEQEEEEAGIWGPLARWVTPSLA